jgi:hypothetical protein
VLILSFCVDLELFLLFWAFLNSSLSFCLALPLFVPLVCFCSFPSSKWPSWVFLSFLGLLAVLHGVLDSSLKLYAFVVSGLIKGKIEKPSDQFLGLIVMSHSLGEVWIRIWDSFVFLLSLFHLENRVCFSRGVQVADAAWRAATRIMAGLGDLVQRTGYGRTSQVLGGRAIERSSGAVRCMHRACGDKEHGFLSWAWKLRSTVSSGLASKPAATIFSSWASKLVATVSPGLTSKPAVSFLVEPQN